jgi:hypothetical protein
MSEVKAFEVCHNYAHIIKGKKIVGHVDFGGDELLMPVGGKTVLFEMHHYFGPVPLNKKTGSGLENIPKGFWDAWERWDLGGKLVNENVCVVPEWCSLCRGRGEEVRHLGGRHYQVVGECKKCHGKKIKAKEVTGGGA